MTDVELQELRKELRKDIRDILKAISEINISLVRVTDSVEHHVKRTDLLERKLNETEIVFEQRLAKISEGITEIERYQMSCPARIEAESREKWWKKNGSLIMAVIGIFSLVIAGATLLLQFYGVVKFT